LPQWIGISKLYAFQSLLFIASTYHEGHMIYQGGHMTYLRGHTYLDAFRHGLTSSYIMQHNDQKYQNSRFALVTGLPFHHKICSMNVSNKAKANKKINLFLFTRQP
jgi:hypothetical protein